MKIRKSVASSAGCLLMSLACAGGMGGASSGDSADVRGLSGSVEQSRDTADEIPGPVISDVTMPSSIQAGERLIVRWRATSPAGVDLAWMFVGGASGFVSWCEFPAMATLASGSLEDGIYEASCDVPSTAVVGTYSVSIGSSAVGGRSTMLDLSQEFEVQGGSTDTEAPLVSEVALSASTGSPGDVLTLTWRVTDETGVDYALPWVTGPNGFFTDPAGALWVGMTATPSLVSGTIKDGVWSLDLPVSDRAMSGIYTFWASSRDTVGNRTMVPLDSTAIRFTVSIVEPTTP